MYGSMKKGLLQLIFFCGKGGRCCIDIQEEILHKGNKEVNSTTNITDLVICQQSSIKPVRQLCDPNLSQDSRWAQSVSL